MICESCNTAEARVHVSNISDGVKHVQYLCEDCAEKQDLPDPVIHSGIKEILENLVEVKGETGESAANCPDCGMTLSLFRRHGRLGCPNDYDLFARPLAQLLEQIHGKTSHSGKAPSEPSPELSLERNRRELMQRLDQAVQNEAYEEAARIRDEIQVIDHQLDGT